MNSTKILPFERDEKQKLNDSQENILEIKEELEIDDAFSDESEGFDQDLMLDQAVRSISTRESKDARGRVKSTKYLNEI